MNSIIEARETTLKYLEPIVKEHGFTVKLSASKQAKIERKTANGKDLFAFELLNYTPSFQIRYAFSKVDRRINDILLDLQKTIRLRLAEDKNDWFIFFSYNTLHKPTETTYLPYMESEEEVKKCVGMVKDFLEDPALPLLERFNDLQEVDRIINGAEPWETDWQKPYVLGGNFHLKRLIISKLAGLGSYDRLLHYLKESYTTQFDGKYGANFKATMAETEALDGLLKTLTVVE